MPIQEGDAVSGMTLEEWEDDKPTRVEGVYLKKDFPGYEEFPPFTSYFIKTKNGTYEVQKNSIKPLKEAKEEAASRAKALLQSRLARFHLQGEHDQQSHAADQPAWAKEAREEWTEQYKKGEISKEDWEAGLREIDEDVQLERLKERHGRGEMAPEMGGPMWAFEGMSPGITSGAEGVLEGISHRDSFGEFDSQDEDIARTILTTLEGESSDTTLFSGHRRPRTVVEGMIEEGVSFPLVATSPDRALAHAYAGEGTRDNPAVIFEFPEGSQAGFYRLNEYIATGEYEVESHKILASGSQYRLKLRQTKRNTVPPITEREEE